MPTLTPAEPTTPTPSKISREHLVLGAILAVVVIGAAAWFLLKGGSGSSATPKILPTKPVVAATTSAAPVAPVVVPAAKKPVVTAKKAAFLKAGNKICTTMNAQEKALGDLPTATAAEATFLAKTVVISDRALTRLRGLHAPAGDAAKLKKIYAAAAHLDALGTNAEKALLAGNKPAAEKLLTELGAAAVKVNASFNAYGLTVCGS